MKRPAGFEPGATPPPEPRQNSLPEDRSSVPKTASVPKTSIAPKTRSPRVTRVVRRAEPQDTGAITVDLSEVRAQHDRDKPVREVILPAEDLSADLSNDEPARPARSRTHWHAQWSPRRIAQSTAKTVRDAVQQRKKAERREMKRFTSAARRRRQVAAVVASAVAALILFVAVGAFTPLMGLQTIQIVGATRLDTAAAVSALEAQKNVPLPVVDKSTVEATLKNFSIVQSYSVELVPPHTMLIRVVERVPILAVQTPDGFDLVDPVGVVVEHSAGRPEGFPLSVNVPLDPASPVFSAVSEAVRALPADVAAQVDTVTASTQNDVAFQLRSSGVQVVWGSAKDSARKGVVLKSALAGLAGRPVTSINVASPDNIVFS